jgi:hypothetical protein
MPLLAGAHFDGRRGTGKATDVRPRIFTFVKEK